MKQFKIIFNEEFNAYISLFTIMDC